jgi:hypothetical protein
LAMTDRRCVHGSCCDPHGDAQAIGNVRRIIQCGI